MRALLGLLALLLGGALAAQDPWATTGEPGGWPQRVVGTEQCLDAFSDRRCRPWYRPGTDPVQGQMWFLLTETGDACAVDARTFVMVILGEPFTCRWRHAR